MAGIISLNIDALDPDVLRDQLAKGSLPNLSQILGEDFRFAVDLDVCSVAPSVTFAAQASIITGEHPSKTGIAGNHFLNRKLGEQAFFGSHRLAHVGNSLAIHGKALADRMLNPEVRTVFESLKERGILGGMFHNLYGRGGFEVRPSAVDLTRFYALKKDKKTIGLLDDKMVNRLVARLARTGHDSSLQMAYFLGLDKASHQYGPKVQAEYLSTIIDRQVGQIVKTLKDRRSLEDTVFAIVSDHSQTEISPEGSNRLQHIQNWEKLLKKLSPSVFDYTSKRNRLPASIIGLNGGFAHLYLMNQSSQSYQHAPEFIHTVKMAELLFEANHSGKIFPELKGTLDLILLRDSEKGWKEEYKVFCGSDSALMSLNDYFRLHPELDYLDPVNRLNNLSSENSGDILLISNWREGHAFHSNDRHGSHGGLSRNQSKATLVLAKPGADKLEVEILNDLIRGNISDRTLKDSGRMPSIVDFVAAVSTAVQIYIPQSVVKATDRSREIAAA